MLTAITLALLTSASSAHPCGMALYGVELPPRPPPMLRPFGAGALLERDFYAVPNAEANDRFVVRWGPDGGVQPSEVFALLDDLNHAFLVQVTTQGHPAPAGMETYKFNVYVGDTGGGAPASQGTGGYFNVDEEGHGFLVISLGVLQEPESRAWTAHHELYHAVQYGIATYTYDYEGAWFWEATAEWAAGEALPNNSYHGSMLGPYVMLSYLGVPFFDYFDDGLLEEYHQYGAFIFARFVTERLGLADAVRQAWLDPDPGNEPILAMRREMEESGIDFSQAMAEYAASTVTWDYAAGEYYTYWATAWLDFYPEQDFTVVGSIPLVEDGVAVAAPPATLPERFGINLMRSEIPTSGTWRVLLEGAGVAGQVVVQSTSTSIVDIDGAVELDLKEGDLVTLAVAAVDPAASPRERIPYAAGVRLIAAAPEEEVFLGGGRLKDEDDAAPFGCAGARDVGPAIAVLALALIRPRRRR